MPEHSVPFRLISIAALVAILDQLTKSMVVMAIGPQSGRSTVPMVGKWLTLQYTENKGIAFGLLAEGGPLLIVVALAVIVVLLRHSVMSASNPWEVTAVGIIVGGAVGNLLDRIRHGFVVDFVSVGAWPNFNLADSAITVGVAMLLLNWVSPRMMRERANLP